MATTTMAQALRELAKLEEMVEERVTDESEPLTDVEVARRINFLLTRAAHGLLDTAGMQAARRVHFLLWGNPEIDLAKVRSQASQTGDLHDANQLTSAPMSGDGRERPELQFYALPSLPAVLMRVGAGTNPEPILSQIDKPGLLSRAAASNPPEDGPDLDMRPTREGLKPRARTD